tara:strand:+ start:5814 stop:7160 length:1347 start_codon:yes stop_codon:yes gene_type:complete
MRVSNRVGYGLGDTAFLLVWQGSALFLLYFYTDVLGLPPGLAGALFLAAMIWDAVSDPLVAAWAERRAARIGRYTPIMAWAALPVGISYALMFLSPGSGVALTAIWALVTHLMFRTAYTVASMPYNTLPARLTTDSRERSVLSGFRVAGAATGGLAAAIATPLIVQASASQQSGYQIAALVVGGAAALLLFVSSRTSGEGRDLSGSVPATRYTADLVELARETVHNGPLLRLVGVMALGAIGYGFFTTAILYFVVHVLGRPDLTTPVLALPALATFLAAPFWVLVSGRTSKRIALVLGVALAATGYMLLALTPGGPLPLLFVAVALAGAGGTAIPVTLWSMVPDAIEYGQLQRGRRVEARSFGLMTFVQKCAAGMTVLAAGAGLGLAGYVPDGPQTASASLAIVLMVTALPAGFMAAIAAVIWHYPIDQAAHRRILDDLAEVRPSPEL